MCGITLQVSGILNTLTCRSLLEANASPVHSSQPCLIAILEPFQARSDTKGTPVCLNTSPQLLPFRGHKEKSRNVPGPRLSQIGVSTIPRFCNENYKLEQPDLHVKCSCLEIQVNVQDGIYPIHSCNTFCGEFSIYLTKPPQTEKKKKTCRKWQWMWTVNKWWKTNNVTQSLQVTVLPAIYYIKGSPLVHASLNLSVQTDD